MRKPYLSWYTVWVIPALWRDILSWWFHKYDSLKHVFVFVSRWNAFTAGDADVVERDYCSRIINLRDIIKNTTVDCRSRNCEIVFRRMHFEGAYRSESVIYNYYGGHVCDPPLTKFTSSGIIFDAMSVIRKLWRVCLVFVDIILSSTYVTIVFELIFKSYVEVTYNLFWCTELFFY